MSLEGDIIYDSAACLHKDENALLRCVIIL